MTHASDQSIAAALESVLEARQAQLPPLRADLDRWLRVQKALTGLSEVSARVRDVPGLPQEVALAVDGLRVHELQQLVSRARELLEVAAARLERRTINVGVTGRARVGKSTLLQRVSGLHEEQLPTGAGQPVTAVRSSIFHSSRSRAVVTLHTPSSFIRDVVAPTFAAVRRVDAPATVADFRAMRDFSPPPGSPPSHGTLLQRLQQVHAALDSFESDLTGDTREVSLGELRQYVAYPTMDELAGPTPVARRYVAVRDVRIDTPFPEVAVSSMGIVDLPGLGELAADAEIHHVRDLRDAVDVVLMLKRPLEGLAFWTEEDGKALDLMDAARGGVQRLTDFVLFVVNRSAGDNEELLQSVRGDLAVKPNSLGRGEPFKVLEADARDGREVADQVLRPVLAHLVDRLPAMDEQVVGAAQDEVRTIAGRLLSALADARRTMTEVQVTFASPAEDLHDRVEELHRDVAAGLAELVHGLERDTVSDEEDPKYLAAVNAAYEDLETWIVAGLGSDAVSWQRDALRRMQVDRNSAPLLGDELNRIRVHISKRYAQLDDHLRLRVEELHRAVASILRKRLGALGEGADGTAALEGMARALDGAAEPCPTLRSAIDDLLSLRVEYRTHVHPRIRAELNDLNLQVRNVETGEWFDQLVVEVSEAGAHDAFDRLSQLAESSAYRARRALIREARLASFILFAAAEQFDDEFIRAGTSRAEFRRLGRSYREEIWPGVFDGMDQHNAHIAQFGRAISAVEETLRSS